MNIITIVFVIPAFPSPAGVNYYELETYFKKNGFVYGGFRPQQGLTIMNYPVEFRLTVMSLVGFPSPAGVNYYESFYIFIHSKR